MSRGTSQEEEEADGEKQAPAPRCVACLMMLLLLAPSLQGLCFVGERDKAGRGE